MKTKEKLKIYISLEHDPHTESPFEHDVFKFFDRFSQGSGALVEALEDVRENKNHVEGKTYWGLSCYRHSGSHWFLKDERPVGADSWDTTVMAGLLVIESADPSEVGPDPTKSARAMVDEYNKWCNGDTWWYSISYEVEKTIEGTCPCCETPNVNWYEKSTKDHDSCGGYIGVEYIIEEIVGSLNHIAKEIPEATSIYEVELQGDEPGKCNHDELADKIHELGFKVEGYES